MTLMDSFGTRPLLIALPPLTVAVAIMLAVAVAAQSAPRPKADPEALRQREQELELLRSEQRRAAETEARLQREIESLGEDRRAFNQQMIDTAARVRAIEEQVANTETRLKPLDDNEAALRKSLESRRAVIAEV